MAFEVSFVPLFIDGQYRSSSTGTTFSVHNPYTKQRVYTAAAASSADCVAAIEAAQRAQPAWEALGPQVRAAMLTRVGTVFESEAWQARLKDAQLAETASPWVMQEYNAGSAAAILRNAAGMANELKGETFPSTIPGGQVVVQRRAQGVIYSVVPWNVPVPVTLRAVTIPIICGNTVVLRPSEYGPRAVAVIVDAFHEAGIPPGVINFVPMSTEDTPKLTSEIISHPFVRAINFTGSDRVGRLIAIEAAKHLKPCILELGGKAPAIVLADADIPTAGRGIVFGGFLNSGQGCMCTERVIVMRPALPALLAAMEDLSASLVVGDPSAPETALSSLFTDAGAENILGLIREAKDAGAEILLGDLQRDGSLVKPHIVVGVKKGMRLWERETFGPVLAVTVADTVQEAIELAIDSEYSLVSSLWTRDVHAAMEVATQIRAGSVNVNGNTVHFEAGRDIAGLGGGSGYGRFDVEHFTDKRILTIHPRERTYPGFF